MTWQEILGLVDAFLMAGLMVGIVVGLNGISRP